MSFRLWFSYQQLFDLSFSAKDEVKSYINLSVEFTTSVYLCLSVSLSCTVLFIAFISFKFFYGISGCFNFSSL